MSNINNTYINSGQTSYYSDSVNPSHNKLIVDSFYIKDQNDVYGTVTNKDGPAVYKNKWFFSPLKDSNYLYTFDSSGKLVPIHYLREMIGPPNFTTADQLLIGNFLIDEQSVTINTNTSAPYQSIPTIIDKLFLDDGRVIVFGRFRYPVGYQSGGLGLTQVVAIISKNSNGIVTANKRFSAITNASLSLPNVRILIDNETRIFELTNGSSSSNGTFNNYLLNSNSNQREITYSNLHQFDKASNIQQAIEYNNLVLFVANSYKYGYTSLYAINKITGITKQLNILFNNSYLTLPSVQIAIIGDTLYALPKKNTNDVTLNTQYLFYKISLLNIDNDLTGDLQPSDISEFEIYDSETETNIHNITPPNNNFHFVKSTTVSTFAIQINNFSIDEITGDIYISAHCHPNITRVYASNGSSYSNMYRDETIETRKLGIRILTKFSTSAIKQFEKFYYSTNIGYLTCLDSEYIYTIMPEITLIGANIDNALFGLCKTGVVTSIPANSIPSSGFFTKNKLCRISKSDGEITKFVIDGYDFFQINHQISLHSLLNGSGYLLNSVIVSWPRFGGASVHGNKSVAVLKIEANIITDEDSSSSSSDSDGYANSSSSSSSQSHSESSYSSQSSNSSSSSSSYEILPDNTINGIFITQGLHNLLPFSFSIEEIDNNSNSELSFSFGQKSTFVYDFNKDAPNGNENDYKSVKSIDMIVSNTDWAPDYSLSVFSNNHSYSKIEDYYLTPKFSWDNPIVAPKESDSEFSDIVYDFEILARTTNSTIYRVQIGEYFTFNEIIQLDNKILGMATGINSSDIYITTNNHIKKYKYEEFLTNQTPNVETYEVISKTNINQDLLLLEYGDYVWSSQAYNGNLVRRTKADMEIDYVFTAMDAIKNIIYSDKHAAYFAFGDKNIWKIVGDSKTIVYSSGHNTIVDASISKAGSLAVILSDNKLKIFKFDLFTVIYNKVISAGFNKIINYKNGFVIINEVAKNSDTRLYNVNMMIFDGISVVNRNAVCENFAYKVLTTTENSLSDSESSASQSEGLNAHPSDAKISNDTLIISFENGVFITSNLTKNDNDYAYSTLLRGVKTFSHIDSSSKYNANTTKIKVFVGSSEGISDKWESGEIETSNNYVYYGGGNNLIPGETYYVNIQTYSDEFGWGNISKQEFIMPI